MGLRTEIAKDWVTAALLVLTVYIITLSVVVPSAATNTLFRTLAQAIVLAGLNGIALVAHFRLDGRKTEEIDRLRREVALLRERLDAPTEP